TRSIRGWRADVCSSDLGVCVDALNGAPGVSSARYGGPELDDVGRYRLLLENMRGARDRTAHFTSAIACAFPNGDTIEAEGICPSSEERRRGARGPTSSS